MLFLLSRFRSVSILWVSCLLIGSLTATAHAEGSHFMSGLPIHDVYPVPSGIMFPSLFTAAGVNPAALPQQDKPASGISLAYSPPAGGGDHEYSLSVASATKTFGWGVSYDGLYDNSPTHGLDAGIGFRSTSSAIGIGLRDADLMNASPQTDIGFLTGTDSDVSVGLVLYHIDASPQLDVGVGFGQGKNYNFELNLLLPAISDLFRAGSNYSLTAATTVYVSVFGLSFKSSYQTLTSSVFQSVSILMYLTKSISINLQYDSPNRTFYGMTFLF